MQGNACGQDMQRTTSSHEQSHSYVGQGKGCRPVRRVRRFRGGIVELLDAARRAAARSVNSWMTASYWQIGRRIVEAEQKGRRRAGYGEQLIERLSLDLTSQFGRGFSRQNRQQMRSFFLTWPIRQTVSGESPALPPPVHPARTPAPDASSLVGIDSADAPRSWPLEDLARMFTLPWSAYVRLLSVKDPYVLEFLDLGDEYSESDLEAALIHRLEDFLLELGGNFSFVGRQRRLRIDQTWYRVDLLFFHRHLRCLVSIDLKLGGLTHADVGQMHMYCNYAREHWTRPDENPPVGLILCTDKGQALARYALEGLPSKIMAANYRTVLPEAGLLQSELEKTRRMLETRGAFRGKVQAGDAAGP